MKLRLFGGPDDADHSIDARPKGYLWNSRGRKEWDLLVFERYPSYAILELYSTSRGLIESIRLDYRHLGALGYAYYEKVDSFKLISSLEHNSVIYKKNKRIQLTGINMYRYDDDVRLMFASVTSGIKAIYLSCDIPHSFFEGILKFAQEKVITNLQ